MKPIPVVSAILIMATALTLGLVIILKTPYFASFFGDKCKGAKCGEEMCAQVITRAVDPVTGQVQEFPTPCDVPEGWELAPNNDNVSGIVEAGGNTIFVFDQQPTNTIFVNGAQLQAAGFVVIHEDLNGSPGDHLAASELLPAGLSSSINVELVDNANEGTKFIAMLHQDDGDGVFDIESDAPLKDSLGNPIQAMFQISSEASPPVDVSY